MSVPPKHVVLAEEPEPMSPPTCTRWIDTGLLLPLLYCYNATSKTGKYNKYLTSDLPAYSLAIIIGMKKRKNFGSHKPPHFYTHSFTPITSMPWKKSTLYAPLLQTQNRDLKHNNVIPLTHSLSLSHTCATKLSLGWVAYAMTEITLKKFTL